MQLQVFNPYTYTLETIIQAGHMKMKIGSVPVEVNAKTRESRLISSIPHYIWRSGSIILRSYVTYKPLRTFLYTALLPFLAGMILCLRWLIFYRQGHEPSLIIAAVLLLMAGLLVSLGILADLISANRRLTQETLFMIRKQQFHSRKSKNG